LWADFDKAWKAALLKHGAEVLSYVRCDALQKAFSVEKDWNEEKVNRLASDLLKVMFGPLESGINNSEVATVLRADYIRAKSEHPTLRPLAAICVNYCVGGLALPKDHQVCCTSIGVKHS